MKMKRWIALLLTSVLTVSTLTACGNTTSQTEGNKNPISESSSENTKTILPLEKAVNFTVFTCTKAPMNDNLAWNTSLERANITTDVTEVNSSEVDEKRNLILSSGTYQDVFFKSGLGNDVNNYGMEGVFIPLEDLMREYAPNFCKVMDETDGWQYITAADGHVYSFPYHSGYSSLQESFWINTRWLDNLGLKEPTSYDELYKVLKAFKEQDANGNGDPNDELPWAASATSKNLIKLMALQDYVLNTENYMAIIDNEMTYALSDESFKELIQYAAKLYDEGLTNADCFTMTSDEMRSNGQLGDIYGGFCDIASFTTVGRDNDDDYKMITPFKEGVYLNKAPYTPGALAITDSCENPEVIVAWADYFYTQEGAILSWIGVEGKTYEVYDDNTWGWLINNGYGEDVEQVRSSATLQGPLLHPSLVPDRWYDMSTLVDPDEVYLTQEALRIYETGTFWPCMTFTEDEQATLSSILTDVNAYSKEYFAKVVIGELSLEDSWDDYLETLEQMRLSEMISIYQDAYAKSLDSK